MTRLPAPIRDHALALARAVPPFFATLVVVPVVVALFGTHWTWERSVAPSRAWKIPPGAVPGGKQGREVRLHFRDDGSDPGRGVELGDGSVLLAELPREVSRFEVVLQVDPNDFYVVLGGPAETALQPLWKVRRERSESVLTTLRSPPLEVVTPVRFLQIEGLRGAGARSVAGLRVDLDPLEIPHTVLVPLLWGLWLLLRTATYRTRWAGAILDRWRGADLWIAAVLIGAVVLKTPDLLVYSLLAVATIWAGLRLLTAWLARSPGSLAATVVVVGLLALIVPRVFEAALTARLAELHDLTVDHRPRPGGEINEDRLRFSGTAADLAEEDFVVLFLGDSFTFGETLEYEDAYPYVFETIVSGFDCAARVRSVNAGWVSSSPLLGLRLLREIGPDYRPDLVVYNLDMTDFHDDLLYEKRLREGGDLEIDAGQAFLQVLVRSVPALAPHLPRLQVMRNVFRSRHEGGEESPVPADRFFVTAQPLERSAADIERGVIRNLAAIHELSTETLGASMALVVYPRAYQYSMEESSESWEGHRYEPLGPWVREPFRYFREKAAGLPYPVLSVLPAFENADRFPLFREDDPHWNEAGARLMAGTVARWAAESRLIPCSAPPE